MGAPVRAATNLSRLTASEAAARVGQYLERALQAAASFEELRRVGEQAEAFRAMFKATKGFLEAQNECAYRKLLIQRAMGEALAGTVRPGNPQLSPAGIIGRLPDGVTASQSARWQALASVPGERFEETVQGIREAGGEVTTAAILMLAQSLQREERPSAPAPVRVPSPAAPADPLEREVGAWARATFPQRTVRSILAHVAEEQTELTLARTPEQRAEEAADLVLLLMSLADLEGWSLAEAVAAKFAVCRERDWRDDPRGYRRHQE
jgi:NTP pyrophosphatase (non-canonical NTP hydrolase)